MTMREKIIDVLKTSNNQTQSEIALKIYGDTNHNTAIHSTLQKMVQDGILTRSEDRSIRYTLVGKEVSITKKVSVTRKKININYSNDERIAYYKIWEITNLIYEATKLTSWVLTPGDDFYVVWQPCGHEPAPLPAGYMAVYSFHNDIYGCLKVGQAGPNSNQWYQRDHYFLDKDSSLAVNLTEDKTLHECITEENVGDWIKENCERYDVIIKTPKNDKNNKKILNMVDGLLEMYFNPRY